MKKLIPLLLCLLLLAGCVEPYDGPTVEKSVLSAKTQEYYGFRDDTVPQKHREEYAYDLYGNRSLVREFYNGEPVQKSVLTYDEAGNVLRQTQYDVTGWFPRKTADNRYRYDDLGRMIRSTYSDGLDTIITYDDEAMTRTTTTDGTTIVEYLNERGWVTANDQTFSDGRYVRDEYDRDADGKLLTSRSYQNGVLVSETRRTYDEQGRILTHTLIQDGVSTLLFSYEYGENYERRTDSDGYLYVTKYHPDGQPDVLEIYDESGGLSSVTRYDYTAIQVPAEEVSP